MLRRPRAAYRVEAPAAGVVEERVEERREQKTPRQEDGSAEQILAVVTVRQDGLEDLPSGDANEQRARRHENGVLQPEERV